MQTAYAMLERPAFLDAIDLQSAASAERERYGFTKFGQSLLLARRLVEAGVGLVTVNWDDDSKHDKVSPHWDTHHDNFNRLKGVLCPLFDQPFAAFVADLHERELLDRTMVVAVGEFGRTPRIGQFSQNAMTKATGRDHWPHAFTALLAGGSAPRGGIHGATSSHAAYVDRSPVSPADLSATVFAHLGIDHRHEYHDEFQNVPRRLSVGEPIRFA